MRICLKGVAGSRMEDVKRPCVRPSLPKLVVERNLSEKIVALAAGGNASLLTSTIEAALNEGTAKLIPPAAPVKKGSKPPGIALCMPVVQATWEGQTSVVSYLATNFSDVVLEDDEESMPSLFLQSLECCKPVWDPGSTESHMHRHEPYIATHIAASLGHEGMLRAAWGASCVEDLGRTPLHWAVLCGQKSTTQYLLGVGAPVNATNNSGITPLMDCINGFMEIRSKACLEVLFLLLEDGAEIEPYYSPAYAKTIVQIGQTLSSNEKSKLIA